MLSVCSTEDTKSRSQNPGDRRQETGVQLYYPGFSVRLNTVIFLSESGFAGWYDLRIGTD